MRRKGLILAAVFLLVIAVFLWRAYAAQSLQVPLAGKLIPQFVDELPFLNFISGTPIELQMTEFLSNILPTGYIPPGVVGQFPGTYVWGYLTPTQVANLATVPSYIGPVVIAERNIPTEIKFVNMLPTNAWSTNVLAWKFSTDMTLHWADPLNMEANDDSMKVATGGFGGLTYPGPPYYNYGENIAGPIPAVVHLHGGEVPPELDGGPDAWFTSDGAYVGHGYYSRPEVPPPAVKNYAIYRYPNSQEAANIWFHDHTLGITRLNVYAGLAGAYVITDPSLSLPVKPLPAGRPFPAGPPSPPPGMTNEPLIPLVIQDRMFDTTGQLFFPADTANNILWATNPEHPYWVPEFIGDTIVVNGKTWPTVGTVGSPLEAKRYRFLFLNGSNARTYELKVVDPLGIQPPPPWWVIGTDGGYLDAPAPIQTLVIMPGERYDVIIDFGGSPNTSFLMRNTGRTPFPKGGPPNGATVGRIVQFIIGGPPASPDGSYNPAVDGPIRTGAGQKIVRLPGTPGGPAISANNVQKFRQLTLNEVMAPPRIVTDPVTGLANVAYPGGPVEVLLNNTKLSGERVELVGTTPTLQHIPGYTPFPDGAGTPAGQIWYSELPNEGDTEVWEIVNLTADAHPIHLHLVQFQIIDRQNFNVGTYTTLYNGAFPGGGWDPITGLAYPPAVLMPGYGPPYDYFSGNPRALGGNPDIRAVNPKNNKPIYLQGRAYPPAPEEAGWKDTVISYPAQVLRFAVRWAPTDVAAGTVGNFPFNPDGHGYVWHCHIIDHEDNEMMRPTSVVKLGITRTYFKGIDY